MIWAWLGFEFIINQASYIAGGVSAFFLIICLSLISDFKKFETAKIHGGRKWWVNTVGMTGFSLQVMGVGIMGSDLAITQPMMAYMFAGVFGFVGFGLFSKAHLMLKQGAENVEKAIKTDLASANRDAYYANAAQPVKTVQPKKQPVETPVSDEYDELDGIANAIIYYINKDGLNTDVTMSIEELEPPEDINHFSDNSKYTVTGQDEIKQENINIPLASIYRIIDYKTKKSVRKENFFNFIEDMVAQNDAEFRRLKNLK